MSCTVCQHPQRREIDQALVAGSATLDALSKEHGLSTSALHRHKAHLQANMHQARERLQNNLLQSCYFWLSQALEMVMATAGAAQAEGNYRLLLQAVAQGTRLINLMLKQDLPLEDQVVHAMLTSPQWAGQAGLFPDDPKLLALGRESLGGIFSAPCPDAPPPAPTSASPAGLDQPALPAVQSNPAKPQLKTENRKLKTENRLLKTDSCLSKWETGGKLAGNECYIMDEEEQYRLLELEKKISQLDLDALTQGLPPVAANDKLDALMEEIYNSIPIPKDKPLSAYLHEQSLTAEMDRNNGS
jgi:hypothetical protein